MELDRDLAARHRLVLGVQNTQPSFLIQVPAGLQKSFTEKFPKRANDIFAKVQFHVLRTLYHAAGMASGEMPQV